MGVLKARVDGAWVEVGGGSGGGGDVLWTGPSAPADPTIELWADTDEATPTLGVGIPAGGTLGQVLTKTSATDYATEWQAPASVLGECRLGIASATQLVLTPWNGRRVLVDGRIFQVTMPGMMLGLTGLTASTAYYICLYDEFRDGNVKLVALPAGVKKIDSADGVWKYAATAGAEPDPRTTVVGWTFTAPGPVFRTEAVLSLFNRQPTPFLSYGYDGATSDGTNYLAIAANPIAAWADTRLTCTGVATGYGGAACYLIVAGRTNGVKVQYDSLGFLPAGGGHWSIPTAWTYYCATDGYYNNELLLRINNPPGATNFSAGSHMVITRWG